MWLGVREMSEGDDENAQERLPEDQLKVNLPQAARHIKYPELKLPEFSAILSTGDSWSTVYQLSLRLAPNTLREWENHVARGSTAQRAPRCQSTLI